MFPVFQWIGYEFLAPWYVPFPPFRVFFQEQPHISDGKAVSTINTAMTTKLIFFPPPAEEGMTNMDESKSGRALNSAEKAEADAPTNKQWLDTIGGPTGSRR